MPEVTKRDEAWDAALQNLARTGSVGTTDIISETDASSQTANRVLKSMEEMGYVERESPRHHTFHASGRTKNLAALFESN